MVSLSCTYNESCALSSIAPLPHKYRHAVSLDRHLKISAMFLGDVAGGMSGDGYVA